MSKANEALIEAVRPYNAVVAANRDALELISGHLGRMLSDLRESGSIEQDADVVLFIYRDDAYYSEDDWERLYPGEPYPEGQSDIIIAKHRNGPTGEVKLHFNKRTTKFENVVAIPPEEKASLL